MGQTAASALLGATTAEWQRQRAENQQSNSSVEDDGNWEKERRIRRAEQRAQRFPQPPQTPVRTPPSRPNRITNPDLVDMTEGERLISYQQTSGYIARQQRNEEYHRQQALEIQRAGEQESVPVANSSFSNLWNSQVTPLINNFSNQWNDFTHNITTPSNFSGPLFNLPIVNGLTSFGSIIDNTLLNGQITHSTSRLNNTLETYPAYHAVNNALSFGMGATLQYINDMSFGLVDRFVNFENGNDAFQSGMEFGRTASAIYGAVEFVVGAATTAFFLSSIPPTGGATVACGATTAGLCLPIGGAALTAEAAGAIAGGVVMTHGIALEAYIANNPLQIRGNGGGSSGNSAYDVAKSGGRHSGMYKIWKFFPDGKIKTTIRSYERVIQEHYLKIANPETVYKNGEWDELPEWRKNKIINDWKDDIARNQEFIDILKGLLQERGVTP